MGERTSVAWTDSTWNPVPMWPPYEVSSDGRIRNSVSGRLLRPIPSDSGHLYVYPKRGRKLYVHRAILEAFVGPCPVGQEGRHLDGNPTNNRLDNLAWGTRLENVADTRRHGRLPTGERSGTAKLTESAVLEIRRLYGKYTLRFLAARFGVSHTAIRRAALGIKWGCVGG